MDIVFMPVSIDVDLEEELIDKIIDFCKNKRISLVYIEPYAKIYYHLKKLLSKYCEIVPAISRRLGKESVILGCDISAISEDVDQIVLIADGSFHLDALKRAEKDIILIDPSKKEVKLVRYNKPTIGDRAKKLFYASESIGFLYSVKVGQRFLDISQIKNLRQMIENKFNKKVFLFLGDTFDRNILFNFPFIDLFINFACPGIGRDIELYEGKIINWNEIKDILYD